MTEGWNPVSVERGILDVVNEISAGIITARDAYERLLEAERRYKLAYARAYMRCEGPAHEKRYRADLDTESELVERDAADVAYSFARDRNRALSGKLDAMRSVGASVRTAYANSGRGEW